jgi:hypothetical protein
VRTLLLVSAVSTQCVSASNASVNPYLRFILYLVNAIHVRVKTGGLYAANFANFEQFLCEVSEEGLSSI